MGSSHFSPDLEIYRLLILELAEMKDFFNWGFCRYVIDADSKLLFVER